GMTCLMPDGAFYAFPNVSTFFGKKTSARRVIASSVDFCDALLSEALVACVPGGGFGADDYIRLSYATSMAQIQKGIERIRAWVAQIK
ncbi:MAG: aminotransferase class I/II-fold pyridoxal phosphate-dependent enzyme, partial [Candidatus Margulisiibacteriota bacterium]